MFWIHLAFGYALLWLCYGFAMTLIPEREEKPYYSGFMFVNFALDRIFWIWWKYYMEITYEA